ncbi:MAG TPA: ATP synthase F0 subunit B [Polyangiaceae bacterium]|nr:ATP synthase F0 subunit B [Polyangiaceae bacterium]
MSIAPTPNLFDALLLSAGGPLDFDKTLIYQAALFSALIVILHFLLFKPMLKIFALREEKTEGAKLEARKMQEKAGELLREYEAEIARVQQVAAEERQKLRNETAKLEAQILDEARVVTTRMIDDGRRKIAEEVNKIRFDLGRESERMSRDIATRVLGREVS